MPVIMMFFYIAVKSDTEEQIAEAEELYVW